MSQMFSWGQSWAGVQVFSQGQAFVHFTKMFFSTSVSHPRSSSYFLDLGTAAFIVIELVKTQRKKTGADKARSKAPPQSLLQ